MCKQPCLLARRLLLLSLFRWSTSTTSDSNLEMVNHPRHYLSPKFQARYRSLQNATVHNRVVLRVWVLSDTESIGFVGESLSEQRNVHPVTSYNKMCILLGFGSASSNRNKNANQSIAVQGEVTVLNIVVWTYS